MTNDCYYATSVVLSDRTQNSEIGHHREMTDPQSDMQIPLIRAAAGIDVAALLQRHGHDPRKVFEQVGIDQRATRDPYQLVPLDRFTALLELAAQQTNIPSFGLEIGSKQDPMKWGAYGYVVLNSPTVGAALSNMATFLRPWQTGTHIAYISRGHDIGIEYSILHPKVRYKSQDAETSLAYVKNIVDRLCHHNVTPTDVFFEHRPIATLSDYKRIFGITPIFNHTVNTITFHKSLEKNPVFSADLQLFPIVRQHLLDMAKGLPQESDIVGTVRHHIRQSLPGRHCNLKDMAQMLAIEPRTLQRRLANKGDNLWRTFGSNSTKGSKAISRRNIHGHQRDQLSFRF